MAEVRTMFKHRGLLIIFLCLIVASILGFLMLANNTPKAQNLFTYKDIVISQEQNVKTVMAAGGNVVVDSNIKGNIFVVDGDLTINAGSKVGGQIVVLGGVITGSPLAELRYNPLVWVVCAVFYLCGLSFFYCMDTRLYLLLLPCF